MYSRAIVGEEAKANVAMTVAVGGVGRDWESIGGSGRVSGLSCRDAWLLEGSMIGKSWG